MSDSISRTTSWPDLILDMDEARRHEFGTDLFAFHHEPLAFYIEPEGYDAVQEVRRPNIHTYCKLMPQTVAMAERMLKRIPQRKVG